MTNPNYPSTRIQQLINDACMAEEIYGLDELEEYAELMRGGDEFGVVYNETDAGDGEQEE